MDKRFIGFFVILAICVMLPLEGYAATPRETVENGVNFLAGADTDTIVAAYEKALTVDVELKEGLYGDGHAAKKIVEALINIK